MKINHFVNFRFENGDYNLTIAYEHEENLAQKIREALNNYKIDEDNDYEDIVGDIMGLLSVDKWTFIHCPTINVN